MARLIFGRRPVTNLNRLHLYFFSVTHGRWKDYALFLIKFLGFWLFVWIITSPILGLFCLALLTTIDQFLSIDIFTTSIMSIATSFNDLINSNELIRLMIQGAEGANIGIVDFIAYSAGAIFSGHFLIEMIRTKRVITIADKIALTTVHWNSDTEDVKSGTVKILAHFPTAP